MSRQPIDFDYLNTRDVTNLDTAFREFVYSKVDDERDIDRIIMIAAHPYTRAQFRESDTYRTIKAQRAQDRRDRIVERFQASLNRLSDEERADVLGILSATKES